MDNSKIDNTPQDSPAVGKAVALLELLCANDMASGVTELSAKTGLNKNMVYRILRSLVDAGWVVQTESGQYHVTLRPFHFFAMPAQRMELAVIAAEPVQALWRQTGESTYLGILDSDAVLYLQHLDATGPLHIAGHVGGRYALHCSAPGKVLLAHADAATFAMLAKRGFTRQSPQTITDAQRLQQELANIHRQGYAIDREEYADGLICFAAPIRDHTQRVIGTVGISAITLYCTVDRLTQEYGPLVLETAQEISRRMGMPDVVCEECTR